MRASSLLAVLVALAVVAAVSTPTTAVTGGWFPIPDINDPHIQELGAWAVAEQDRKLNDGLKFNRVVGGDGMTAAAGVKYRLVIDASNPEDKYEAVLTEQVWANTRTLLSFDLAD